jgi:hypothetical protein
VAGGLASEVGRERIGRSETAHVDEILHPLGEIGQVQQIGRQTLTTLDDEMATTMKVQQPLPPLMIRCLNPQALP